MRHINYVLKPATIDNAKPKDKRYDLPDGGGLVLQVMPSGSKTWRFKYHLNGKRTKVTIGAYPSFTIKHAAIGTKNCAHWSSAARARPKPSVCCRRNRSSPPLGG